VGLVAAAHLLDRGLTPIVLEAGDRVGASVRRWGHVRLFSPWRFLVDETAASLLGTGWKRPDPDEIPTGHELVDHFVEPLGAALREHVHLDSRVMAIGRRGFDLMKTPGRDASAFEVRFETAVGTVGSLVADAVIDASGTYDMPGPLGANGLPAEGEAEAKARGLLYFGVPNLDGADRERFTGRRIAVVGSGHTAFNALLALNAADGVHSRDEDRADRVDATDVTWVVRGRLGGALHGQGEEDQLSERGRLEVSVRNAVAAGGFETEEGFAVRAVSTNGADDAVTLVAADARELGPFDRVVVATGYRPDLDLTRELRLDLDPAVEAPRALAPLIDPNVHSCGTVPPHGFRELGHPEANFFTVGMKSYGRAPTFLLLTGYEQVRSVSCYLAGDMDGAEAVMLDLPESGVCVTEPPADRRAGASGACGCDEPAGGVRLDAGAATG
jgi:thioredoxin reductase